MAKRKYINPSVIEGTMRVLQNWKDEHPSSQTPMAEYVSKHGVRDDDRARFVRAAQRLGWDVVRSQGKIYENGVLVWNA